jgi:hypothetical protein
MYDFKPTILFIGTLLMQNVDEVLKTGALLLNITYLSFQFYKFHKKNKE